MTETEAKNLQHYVMRIAERKAQEELSDRRPISKDDIINLRIELETQNV